MVKVKFTAYVISGVLSVPQRPSASGPSGTWSAIKSLPRYREEAVALKVSCGS